MFGPLKAAETLERPEIWEVYNHSEAQQMAVRVGLDPDPDDEFALRALYAAVSGQVALRAVDTFLPGLDAAAIEALSELHDEAVAGDLN